MNRVHFIAIGGSAMHNLAIDLYNQGYDVSGSDDEIFEPALSKLKKYDLLPESIGWHPEIINDKINFIILGMHAKADNPELLKAKELGLQIYSYPDFLYKHSENKLRVVIGGSHGKTSITSMIMHVLKYINIDFDYMVGSKIDGFDTMVRLTKDSNVIIIEGDEYLASPLDPRPKFHIYKPHIALISGIEWDHINVFPTFDNYKQQFSKFIDLIEQNGTLIYTADDSNVIDVVNTSRNNIKKLAYKAIDFEIKDGITYIETPIGKQEVYVFGLHNMKNIAGAHLICKELGVDDMQFFEAIQTFKGSSKRLELIYKGASVNIYKDFAHSPSKLKATIDAVKAQFPERQLIAFMELHTYSSLNKDFLPEYSNAMDKADVPIVFYNNHALELKRMPPLDKEYVKKCFKNNDLKVFDNLSEFNEFLNNVTWEKTNLLLMSSGNFGNLNIANLIHLIESK
ncbi:MAG: peptidoglycan synthetase [Bacteroidetes bacterium GWE2_29_8]|nr:MAG: peptidoglycan synthetase [Bacteroidetes bacterium GWE2_29_8]OFY14422.1 MAG: peptidoglycan synthetase [Bacteroidetes bacterium GWF2_29_10]